MKQLTIVVCLFLASCCFCEKLPSSFQRCNRYQTDFNQCLRLAVEDAIRQLNRPVTGFTSLEPVEVPFLTINVITRSVGLEKYYKNVKFFGFTNINLLNLEMNFNTKTLFMDCFFPEIRWEFDYDFDNGVVFSMPIKGRGPGSFIMRNVRYLLTFTLDEYEKEGEKYFKVVAVKCVMEPELIKVNFENLFDGDKILGDNMNKIINDNWRLLYDEVRPGYEDSQGQIFSALFNRLLANVSITELFGAELNRFSPYVNPFNVYYERL